MSQRGNLEAFERVHRACASQACPACLLTVDRLGVLRRRRFATNTYVTFDGRATGQVEVRCIGCGTEIGAWVEPSEVNGLIDLFIGNPLEECS